MIFQLVPPNNHCRNNAEKVFNTFKNHFIAGLTTLHKNFPLDLWYRLFPHAKTSLNMLCSSNLRPPTFLGAEIYGMFDYNRTSILPSGLKL